METVADDGRHNPPRVYGELAVNENDASSGIGTVLSVALGQRPEEPNHPARKLVGGAQHGVQVSVVVLVPPDVPVAPPAGGREIADGPV